MNRIEALADAIAERSRVPGSPLYALRNPGGLRYQRPFHPRKGEWRTFDKWVSGYEALCFDLATKCRVGGYSGLLPSSTLIELLRVFDYHDEEAAPVITFLRAALKQSITESTPISFFMES